MRGRPSSLQQVEVVGRGSGAAAEDGHDDPEADDDLGRRHHQDEEHQRLAADVVELSGEGDEGEVHGVEHELDAHEHDEHVAPDQQAHGADGEQARGQGEVPLAVHGHSPSPPSWGRGGRRASTTAPTTAITSSTEVISKGSRYRVKIDSASFSTFSPSPLAGPATDEAPVVHSLPASNTTSASNSTAMAAAAGRWPRSCSTSMSSSRSTPSSMMTNRKSTTMAPA